MLRHQLPVYSPLSARAVLSGVKATLTGGEEARRDVRSSLRAKYDPASIILTDSGTTALTLALRAVCGPEPSRPVALPAYSCYDVATAAVGADVTVRLYDLDPETLSPDLASLQDTVERGVCAIVVAHLHGIPLDLTPVLDVAREVGIPVVEDAAQAAGARYGDRPLGSFGSLSVLSFGRGKGITGCGGGALLANDRTSAAQVARLDEAVLGGGKRGYSQLPELVGQWLLGRPGFYGIPTSAPFLKLGETIYREPQRPRAMSALSAGVLRTARHAQQAEMRCRSRNADRLRKTLVSSNDILPVAPPQNSEPSYLRFPVNAFDQRSQILASEAAGSLGVMRGYPKPLDRLDAMKGRCLNRSQERPGATALTRRLFTIPTHSLLTRKDLREIEQLLLIDA